RACQDPFPRMSRKRKRRLALPLPVAYASGSDGGSSPVTPNKADPCSPWRWSDTRGPHSVGGKGGASPSPTGANGVPSAPDALAAAGPHDAAGATSVSRFGSHTTVWAASGGDA